MPRNWCDQRVVIGYELIKHKETITGECYQAQLMKLSGVVKVKRAEYAKRQDKVVIHDRSHVAKQPKNFLETRHGEVLRWGK